jgi:hypothetical protein
MTAAIPASDIQTPGTAYVYVMDISGVTSTKVLFTIQ